MLHNCKVAHVLPRIADCAKNDRNAVLRARCCEYALLILEHWPDAPEIKRSADLYEDFIRYNQLQQCATHFFAKTCPERSRRLFSSFDTVMQRIINEDHGGMHRRHAPPSLLALLSLLHQLGLLLCLFGHLLQLYSLWHSLQVHLCPHLHLPISLIGQLSCSTKFLMLLRKQRLMGNLHVLCFQLIRC
ncbi:CLIP-associated protein-like [Pistacia vera]|uniref:CLIP-associated protein-like n=1 Tax=Pistacia vera TaxID=55513 RepID=UPI001262C33D|nr:CLIP-associated protein-like [Pistacia vera]